MAGSRGVLVSSACHLPETVTETELKLVMWGIKPKTSPSPQPGTILRQWFSALFEMVK